MSTFPAARFLNRSTPPHVTTLILMAGLSSLNMSIFLPALSSLADYFNTDYSVMQIAVSGYIIATAVVQLVVGPISDRFGRRPVALWGGAIFVLATFGAMLAKDVTTFLLCRFLQATLASVFVMGRAAVRDIYDGDKAAAMLGWVTMGMSVVPMVGPIIGGALMAVAPWQSIFVVLIGMGVLVYALTWADMGETARGTGQSLRVQAAGYAEVLRSVRFWGYVACTTFGSGTYFALLGGGSFVSEKVFGLSPLGTGIALGVPAFGYLFGNFVSARYVQKLGLDRMALWGALVTAVALIASLAIGLLGMNTAVLFVAATTFMGFGNGMTMPSASAGAMAVRPDLAGMTSGLSLALQISGAGLISAFAGSLLDASKGAVPLQALMAASAVFSVLSMVVVMRRARRLGLN